MWRKFSFIISICFVCVKLSAQYKGSIGDGYAMCMINNLTILPVELNDFEAVLDGKSVRIIWKTLSEINNSYFEIERSKDLVSWGSITRIDGANNSNQLIQYEWTDENPNIGVVYYRLKQVDFDGKFTHSKIVSVMFSDSCSEKIIIYPNPNSSGVLFFDLNCNDQFLLTIFTFAGQVVCRKELTDPCVDIRGINMGVYTIHVENINTGITQNIKLVIY